MYTTGREQSLVTILTLLVFVMLKAFSFLCITERFKFLDMDYWPRGGLFYYSEKSRHLKAQGRGRGSQGIECRA